MMNSNCNNHRIWQPSVEVLTDNVVPHPSRLIHHLNSNNNNTQTTSTQQQQQLYTRTSLKSSSTINLSRQNQQQNEHRFAPNNNRDSFDLKSLNQEILNVSQAFNNSPRPFTRNQSEPPQPPQAQAPHPLASASIKRSQSPPSNEALFKSELTSAPTNYNQEKFDQKSASGRLLLRATIVDNDNNKLAKQLSTTSLPHHHQVPSSQQAIKQVNQQQAVASSTTPSKQQQQQQQTQQEEDMSPQKLVHQQYNSPIDLYSMNNIRKTIEAHTELIAPGIKGINFMKDETPVNKQSEVYKMVMEEEHRSRCGRDSGQRLSPISGQPLHIPTALVEQQQKGQQYTEQHYLTSPSTMMSASLHQQQHQHQQEAVASGGASFGGHMCESNSRQQHQTSFIRVNPVLSQDEQQQNSGDQQQHLNYTQNLNQQQQQQEAKGGQVSQQVPSCCECGQFIVGPFAKIQNRFVHPQCFNCTTCGTSLKNVGYFTVNDKLYCDIHARQVANMMHRRFDYVSALERQQQSQTQTRSLQQQQQQQQQSQQQSSTSSNIRLKQTPTESQHTNSSSSIGLGSVSLIGGARQPSCFSSNSSGSSSTNPATISTMFADRTSLGKGTSTGHFAKNEVSWAPSTVQPKEQHSLIIGSSSPSTSACSSTTLCANTNSSSMLNYHQRQQESIQKQQHHQPFSSMSSGVQHHQNQHLDQQTVVGVRERGMLQESSINQGGRIPVCYNCRVQIQGPYILAGKTTWCKPCSQTHFNCSSCHKSLLDIGFIEDNSHKYYCEHCFEAYYAPICSKCNLRIKGDCLNALNKQWHPSCFICGHCRRPFGNSSFYLEDNVPYCERDWNVLFTTKCYACSYPIEAGDKWIEALERNYHSNCFRCTSCQINLEGSTFYCKGGKPFCRLHAR